jgi:hypothetical protein
MDHEIFVDLFKNCPSLAAEILVEVLGVSLPDYTEARIASADLTEIRPAEYRADAVVLLLHNGSPVRVVIVEVQLAIEGGGAAFRASLSPASAWRRTCGRAWRRGSASTLPSRWLG